MTGAVDVASVNGVDKADLGVHPGILDRNFTDSDEAFDENRKQPSWADASQRDRKRKVLTMRQQLLSLERIQTARPLGPPGTAKWAEAMAHWHAQWEEFR